MRTIKKKDIKNYKPIKKVKVKSEVETEENEDVEVIDELVGPMGGEISGDDKNVNNSEIETAPQATTDDFAAMAIQPNRYLYGVTGSAYSHGSRGGTMESVEAKDKMIKLLEEMGVQPPPINDINNNQIPDISELQSHISNKIDSIVLTVEDNNLDSPSVAIIINEILSKLIVKLDENDFNKIKNKF